VARRAELSRGQGPGRTVLQTAPANAVALSLASTIAFWQRDCPAMDAWSRKLREAYSNFPNVRFNALSGGGFCQDPTHAKVALEAMLQDPPNGFASPYYVAAVSAVADDAGHAMTYLESLRSFASRC